MTDQEPEAQPNEGLETPIDKAPEPEEAQPGAQPIYWNPQTEAHQTTPPPPSQSDRLLVMLILAVNVAFFLFQQADRNLTPRLAAYPPGISAGQWYRLLTPMLLHADFLHLAFNSYALWAYGPTLEGAVGKIRFGLMYVISGFTGGVASFTFSACNAFGVGASGAIFGVVGALGVLFFRHRKANPGARAALKGIVIILGLNLVIGLTMARIDNYAHIGGLLGGALLATAFDATGLRNRRSLPLQLLASGTVVALAVTAAIWRATGFNCP